jgi:hypothetical protein
VTLERSPVVRYIQTHAHTLSFLRHNSGFEDVSRKERVTAAADVTRSETVLRNPSGKICDGARSFFCLCGGRDSHRDHGDGFLVVIGSMLLKMFPGAHSVVLLWALMRV